MNNMSRLVVSRFSDLSAPWHLRALDKPFDHWYGLVDRRLDRCAQAHVSFVLGPDARAQPTRMTRPSVPPSVWAILSTFTGSIPWVASARGSPSSAGGSSGSMV